MIVQRVVLAVLIGLFLIVESCWQGGDSGSEAVEHVAQDATPRPEAVDGIRVRRVRSGIELANGTEQPLAYAVWAQGFLGEFAPCDDPGPTCLRLEPGARVVVPFDEIVGNGPDEVEAVVRWWRVVRDGAGGYRVDDLHVIGVALED